MFEGVDVEIHVFQTYDIGDDGTAEYRGALDLAASTRDADSDGHNESASVQVTAYEALDRNMDGYDELAHGIEVSFALAAEQTFDEQQLKDAFRKVNFKKLEVLRKPVTATP